MAGILAFVWRRGLSVAILGFIFICIFQACVGYTCDANSDCRLGERCNRDGVCVFGCDTANDCPAGLMCLDGQCDSGASLKVTVNMHLSGSYKTWNGEKCWSRHTVFAIWFDTSGDVPMDKQSVYDNLVITPSDNLGYDWKEDGDLVIYPNAPEQPGPETMDFDWQSNHYDVHLSPGAHDIDGHTLDHGYDMSFCVLPPGV